MASVDVVTGAASYTGQYITRRLLAAGHHVKSLTRQTRRENPFGNQVALLPFHFDNLAALTANLEGVETLYNTYWVRFGRGCVTFDAAVDNSRRLFQAAKAAGVRKVVHLSVTHADEASPLAYYRGKGRVERILMASGLRYAIIRPTLIFGTEDILVNNIAWLLRTFPLFAIPGSGAYRLQPVSVEDVAEIAVSAAEATDNQTMDAAGPETFTYTALVQLIARSVGSRARLIHAPPAALAALSTLVGWMVRDVLLTRAEIEGLMTEQLVSSQPPRVRQRFTEWLHRHASVVGRQYVSELNRHWR